MGQPAAKQGDKITAIDQHTLPGTPPQVVQIPFAGALEGGLSNNVNIQGMPAATVGSTALTKPPHPTGSSLGTIREGSTTVFINGKKAARNGDSATTCDEAGKPGTVVATGTVLIGD
jgi:uncharacterized Zn-binding protein involved in type VI secretion